MRGPNMVPCGTPEVTLDHDEYLPFTTTLCSLLVKKLLNQLNTLLHIP